VLMLVVPVGPGLQGGGEVRGQAEMARSDADMRLVLGSTGAGRKAYPFPHGEGAVVGGQIESAAAGWPPLGAPRSVATEIMHTPSSRIRGPCGDAASFPGAVDGKVSATSTFGKSSTFALSWWR
jgi:hypothetical protein